MYIFRWGKMATRETYRYTKEESIVTMDHRREERLTDNELGFLYRFYILEPLSSQQSLKAVAANKRGWRGAYSDSGLKNYLVDILNLFSADFVFTETLEVYDLQVLFDSLDLSSGPLSDFCRERCVLTKTPGSNPYYKVFYRVRNCLAHGNFRLLKDDAVENGAFFVMEDRTRGSGSQNVTARMVFAKSTLFGWANAVLNAATIGSDS